MVVEFESVRAFQNPDFDPIYLNDISGSVQNACYRIRNSYGRSDSRGRPGAHGGGRLGQLHREHRLSNTDIDVFDSPSICAMVIGDLSKTLKSKNFELKVKSFWLIRPLTKKST